MYVTFHKIVVSVGKIMSGTTPGLATSNDLSAFNSWQIELFPSVTVTVLGLA